MNKMIKAGVIGATGYAGAELVRLLTGHPDVVLAAVSSTSYEGKELCAVYPNLSDGTSRSLTDAENVVDQSDVVFAALPHGLSEPLANRALQKGAVFIDLGADFRLYDEAQYQAWYGKAFSEPALHRKARYCLPEIDRAPIRTTDLIANPGCYPTSIALGLMPALRQNLVSLSGIVIDSKSGVTGAGRGLTQTSHFPDANEAFSAYKAGIHRHTPEIEQTLCDIARQPVAVTFVPHLLPVNRGILSTIYCKTDCSLDRIYNAYQTAYDEEYFVRLMPKGEYANIKNVRMSNYCDISLHFDEHTGTLIITSAIDNMVKGAAGQAIQNMNIRFGFAETAGLAMLPPAF